MLDHRLLLVLSLTAAGCQSESSHRRVVAVQLPAQSEREVVPQDSHIVLSPEPAQPISTSSPSTTIQTGESEERTSDHQDVLQASFEAEFEALAKWTPEGGGRTEPRGATDESTGSPDVDRRADESSAESSLDVSRYVIDLPTVLRLAGADNWGVRLAYERIREAQAQLDSAEVMWLPSLNLGVGYTKHDGQIQATNGQIVDVSRNALFVGGGAVTANAPTTGGSGGPARLFVDLSLADAIFQPLAARQSVNSRWSAHARTFNDTQLAASLAYYDLVGAQGMLAVGLENLTDAQRLEEMTQAFVAAGKTSEAEVMRVQVVSANRQQSVIDSELAIRLASANLAQLIQLDPAEFGIGTLLQSVETHIVPVELTPAQAPLDGLIAQGRGARAEVAEEYARVQSEYERVRLEKWRPWIPNLHVGVSAGGFGGGVGSDIDGLDGRSDVDAILVWQLRNLGFGAEAAQQEQCSRYRQAVLRSGQIQDLIAAEVKQAWSEVEASREQIELTRRMLTTASEVYDRNLTRIRGLEGLPLEAIQALDAVASARRSHLAAIIRFNQAQLMLLRAIGQPLEGY